MFGLEELSSKMDKHAEDAKALAGRTLAELRETNQLLTELLKVNKEIARRLKQ